MAKCDGDFQIVSHRKAARRKSSKGIKTWQVQESGSDDVQINIDLIIAKLKDCR